MEFLIKLYIRLLRFGFRLLYNEFAFTYDLVSWVVSMGEWRSWQRAAIPHLNVPAGSLILELAHGTANLHIDLRNAGYRMIGLDLSPYMGAIARRKLLHHSFTPQLVRGKAQTLPFPDASFDAVVSTFPTEFIVDPATIREIYRVLKPDARLVFVPNGALTGRGVIEKGVELAYKATGQRAAWPDHIMDRFTAAGFKLTTLIEPCYRSIAQVVIAKKIS
jgi:ubiquinone/menaquinone biosynthesis C-methylase UbiE